MVEEVMQEHKTAFQGMKMNLIHSGLDEQTTGERAYSYILTELQKELASIYWQRLQWVKHPKNVNDDDFHPGEAVEAAVTGRKFLIKRRLEDCSFTEDGDDDKGH